MNYKYDPVTYDKPFDFEIADGNLYAPTGNRARMLVQPNDSRGRINFAVAYVIEGEDSVKEEEAGTRTKGFLRGVVQRPGESSDALLKRVMQVDEQGASVGITLNTRTREVKVEIVMIRPDNPYIMDNQTNRDTLVNLVKGAVQKAAGEFVPTIGFQWNQ